ncbi:hypothetical protein PR048_019660 [Dryococelus australis]|uniref:MIT domain-containing protein n=1 Tax=Dryococelus australis TaxID=614101 RepID=A0ABQ9H465_9NEOP|nr:hypothetical protein PR048_019660 [Dryococelus australis]
MSKELLEDVHTFSGRAVQFDKAGQHEIAAYYYREAASILDLAVKDAADEADAEAWQQRARDYRSRADILNKMKCLQPPEPPSEEFRSQKELQQCHFLFSQALSADEVGLATKAVELYSKAIELALNAVSQQCTASYIAVVISVCMLQCMAATDI